MRKVFFHIDIDAFFAAVEQADDPRLAGKPVIVGAQPGTRGVVSACSYEARKFGIRSAMPISEAYRLCPTGHFLPVRMGRYLQVSGAIMAILRGYTPEFKQLSVDEALLNMTGTERLFGPATKTAATIKNAVLTATHLTISIGIAVNPYLAKLASEARKPDGLVVIEPGTETAFLDSLGLEKLWGVGKKTLERLIELNIDRIAKLRSFSRELLVSLLGKGTGEFLYTVSRGDDPGFFSEQAKSSSVSHETTFEKDTKDILGLKNAFLELSQSVMDRLIKDSLKARTLFIKLRLYDFKTTTAQKTLKHWVASTEELCAQALDLFQQRWDGFTPIRLIGVGVSGVVKQNYPDQLELFTDENMKKSKLEQAVSELKNRHRGLKMSKASLIRNPRRKKNRENST